MALSDWTKRTCPECNGRGFVTALGGYENHICQTCNGRRFIAEKAARIEKTGPEAKEEEVK